MHYIVYLKINRAYIRNSIYKNTLPNIEEMTNFNNIHKKINIIFYLILVFFLSNCNQFNEKKQVYENQIGDTPFDIDLDDKNFKFCDATNVLHKRAQIKYKGGTRALEEELLKKYNLSPSYTAFNGYFVIRFAVNCNNQTGRFRMQTLDSNFNQTQCPADLEKEILSIVKGLKGWEHAFYRDKDYDCYTFINIKMINGQIEKA